MKIHQLFLFLSTSFLLSFCSDESNPKRLFVENQDDWITNGNADWSISDGELIARLDSGMGFVITKEAYTDFELKLEFMPDSTINSGVFVRCDQKITSARTCYEINIWDLHPKQENRTGAIVLIAEPLAFVETLNKWNSYRIKCEKGRIEAWINGEKTADLNDSQHLEGYIALQAAQKGEIRFKNIAIKKLGD
jgi:hypothetical protein